MPGIPEREVRTLLVGIGAVVDHVAGEVVFPGGDHVEQQVLLDIDEHGQMIDPKRHFPAAATIDLGGDLFGSQFVILR